MEKIIKRGDIYYANLIPSSARSKAAYDLYLSFPMI